MHKPDLRVDSSNTQASFATGNQVGHIARQIYDPKGMGRLIDLAKDDIDAAFIRTKECLALAKPIFEAGFVNDGVMAFADVMLPLNKKSGLSWKMIEVKSSSSVKDYHREDVAIQTYVAKSAGVKLSAILLSHIDTGWVYPGGANYDGLLVEEDLTDEAFSKEHEVIDWIAKAKLIARSKVEPKITTGDQCKSPYACGFLAYCQTQQAQAQYPIYWIPKRQQKALKDWIAIESAKNSALEMKAVPDNLLNDVQRRVKKHTLANTVYFDAKQAAASLAPYKLPAYFLDFETIQFGIPVWKGTRPFQMIPFQFSVHRLSRTGALEHQSFLDLSGKDPSRALAQCLIEACPGKNAIFVYNASFETARIRELAQRFPRYKNALLKLNERIVDLWPIAQNHYYHPSQQGSWSIKKVLPAIAPELQYGDLDGVQDGGMAMGAYFEAINPQTTVARKDEIEQELINYCRLDTYAMVRLWKFFSGRKDLKI
jgi:hypothetical protein